MTMATKNSSFVSVDISMAVKFIHFVILSTICVNVSGEMEPFVVGGGYANIKQYPHSVLMIVDCAEPFLCGGSILTDRIVLTAGHCLYPCKSWPDFTILLKYGHQTSEYMISTVASKFVTHSRYDDWSLQNDIGLAYADTHMELNDNVKRVAIVNNIFRKPKYGYVAGWGVINSQGETAASLKHVKQSFPPKRDCDALGVSSPGVICAGGMHAREYPDQGDSGSALVIFDYIQIGIVSFRLPDYGLVGYTNTTYYYDWIVATSSRIFCTL